MWLVLTGPVLTAFGSVTTLIGMKSLVWFLPFPIFIRIERRFVQLYVCHFCSEDHPPWQKNRDKTEMGTLHFIVLCINLILSALISALFHSLVFLIPKEDSKPILFCFIFLKIVNEVFANFTSLTRLLLFSDTTL